MKKKKLFEINEKLKILQSLTNEEIDRLRGGDDSDPSIPLPPTPTPTLPPQVTMAYTPPPTTPNYHITGGPGGVTGGVTVKF